VTRGIVSAIESARENVDAIESVRKNVEVREGRKVTVRADRTSEGNVMVITSTGTNTMTARIRPSNVMDMDVNKAVDVAAAEATNATEDIMDGDTM